ncbi:hypothetical protein [Mesorhizobium loti]|uniref:hypothetical protein n=1 Tax=Rhizobium loti TaxID=381 RepID=UPI00041DC8B0|nr:hypothetical protein [Mesorhizobium loti]
MPATKLASAPCFITSMIYEADGQTKEIKHLNGVKPSFTYSPTRRWVTHVTTGRGAAVLLVDANFSFYRYYCISYKILYLE